MKELPELSRGGKPRKASYVSQMIGCYCYKMNSLLREDGGDCYNCREAAKMGAPNLTVDEDGKLKSTCEICSCRCQVIG